MTRSLFVWETNHSVFLLYQEACKLGSSLMKLKEEHGNLKSSYQLLQEEHEKLQKQHAEDNGKYSLLTSRL